MSTVASVDYVAKRIYLSSTTTLGPLDTMQVYRDVRELRRLNESHRKHRPMIIAGGNIQKTATTYTAPYVQLLYGCRLVPYDSPHSLLVVRDTFSDDGQAGVGCFDRSQVSSEVDIDFSVDKVEVRTVHTAGGGSGLTAQEVSDAVWMRVIEAGFTAEQLMRLKAAVEHGDATGLEGSTPSFKSLDGLKDRIVATYVGGVRTILSRDGA